MWGARCEKAAVGSRHLVTCASGLVLKSQSRGNPPLDLAPGKQARPTGEQDAAPAGLGHSCRSILLGAARRRHRLPQPPGQAEGVGHNHLLQLGPCRAGRRGNFCVDSAPIDGPSTRGRQKSASRLSPLPATSSGPGRPAPGACPPLSLRCTLQSARKSLTAHMHKGSAGTPLLHAAHLSAGAR